MNLLILLMISSVSAQCCPFKWTLFSTQTTGGMKLYSMWVDSRLNDVECFIKIGYRKGPQAV